MPQPGSSAALEKQYYATPGTTEWDELIELTIKKLKEMNEEERELFWKSVYNNL